MSKYPLCPNNNWCYFEAIDNYTIIIEIVYLLALSIFTYLLFGKFKFLVQLRRNQNQRKVFGKGFMKVYYLIISWLTSSIIKVIINILVFYLIMTPNQTIQPHPTQPIVILSSIFNFLQFICGFCLLTLMLLIPYSWVNQLLLNTRQNQTIEVQVREKLNYFFNYLKVVKFYSKWIRPFFVVWLFIEPILLFFVEDQIWCHSMKYNVYFIYFESLLIFITYIFGYSVTKYMQAHNLLVLAPSDKKKLVREYIFLFLVMVLRICLSFIFKISSFYKYSPNQTCYDTNNKTSASIFLILGQFLMHLFPVCVILYIYWPSVEESGDSEQQIVSFIQQVIRGNRNNVHRRNRDVEDKQKQDLSQDLIQDKSDTTEFKNNKH